MAAPPYEELSFKSKSFHISFILLRLVTGGVFLEAGLHKIIEGFSAAGYLANGTGPFASWFASMVPAADVLSVLVIVSETLIGIALIFGVFVRLASLSGAVMMLLYYLPYLPPANSWIDEHIILIFVFVVIIFSGSGYFFGIDRWSLSLESRWPRLRFILRLILG
jgi:thiosulfate dehydrogenase [quinone] large subunit